MDREILSPETGNPQFRPQSAVTVVIGTPEKGYSHWTLGMGGESCWGEVITAQALQLGPLHARHALGPSPAQQLSLNGLILLVKSEQISFREKKS